MHSSLPRRGPNAVFLKLFAVVEPLNSQGTTVVSTRRLLQCFQLPNKNSPDFSMFCGTLCLRNTELTRYSVRVKMRPDVIHGLASQLSNKTVLQTVNITKAAWEKPNNAASCFSEQACTCFVYLTACIRDGQRPDGMLSRWPSAA